MTNKEIIIDGVKVTECVHRATNRLGNDIGTYCRCFTGSCYDIHDCHYKNWKRKEQECEWWKRQAELGSDTTDRLAKQLEEKEQELDECREKLHKQLDQLKAENEKYKQALQEIQDYCNKYPQNSIGFKQQILQKCEVLKDE